MGTRTPSSAPCASLIAQKAAELARKERMNRAVHRKCKKKCVCFCKSIFCDVEDTWLGGYVNGREGTTRETRREIVGVSCVRLETGRRG